MLRIHASELRPFVGFPWRRCWLLIGRMDRRLFLALTGAVFATPRQLWAAPPANLPLPSLRRLKLTNAHTGETFEGTYRNDAGPIPTVMDELSVFLRDHHSGERMPIDVGVIDFLACVMESAGQPGATVLSAYRTPETNARHR